MVERGELAGDREALQLGEVINRNRPTLIFPANGADGGRASSITLLLGASSAGIYCFWPLWVPEVCG